MEYEQILELIRNKEKAGLEALYKTYGEKFFWYAVKKWSLSEDHAWDVVYQTLDMLVLRLTNYQFESKSHFENFLFKVFTNFLRQFYRKSQKQHPEPVSIESLSGELIDATGQSTPKLGDNVLTDESVPFDDDAELVENPKLTALKIALRELSSQERDILLLRAQNYSYDEIATLLTIENNQLKVRHYRAKNKLIQLINSNSIHHE